MVCMIISSVILNFHVFEQISFKVIETDIFINLHINIFTDISILNMNHKLTYSSYVRTELYEQAIKYEKGSFITASGALATLSGAKTGRSPRDKRVVKDEETEIELWWGK